MGMAASQSRFLALTARKTNTEYQGQQVNQQRTVLSNESSNLYNQMLALEVPTPPSSSRYYNTTYSFSDGDGGSFSFTNYSILSQTATINYTTKGKKLVSADVISGDVNSTTDSSGNVTYAKVGEHTLTKLSDATSPKYSEFQQHIKDTKTYGNWKDQDIYTYSVAKDGKTTNYYLTGDMLESLANSTSGIDSVSPVTLYDADVIRSADVKANFTTNKANNSGRLTSIEITSVENWEEVDPSKRPVISGKTFDLEISRVDDEDAYDEAMKEYEYQKALYDKKIEDINAKTASVQAKDKNLELKLKQLDTEQNAIQTEMEAVQKVIEKNVEDTFKTFA